MVAFSNFLEEALLNHVLRNTAYTSPTTVYLALFTSTTTDAGGGTEVTGGSYARQVATFDPPVSSVVALASDVTFPIATADWGIITHFAIYDAVSAGNSLYHGPLAASRTINNGDTFRFLAGNINVAHD